MNPRLSDTISAALPRLKGHRFVGLHGRKRSGKGTFLAGMQCASHMEPALPGVHDMSFGTPLKDATKALFGGQDPWYYGSEEERSVVSPYWRDALGEEWSTGRKILQRLGTEVFRDHVSHDFWILVILRKIMDTAATSPLRSVFVFGDVRFLNEAEFVRALGGEVLHIINTNQVHTPRDDHASERTIDFPFADVFTSDSALVTQDFGINYYQRLITDKNKT